MKPPKFEKTDFEKVATDDFVIGEIEAIQYDQEHKFKGYEGGEDKIRPAVRFKFKIDGYKFSHYSRWMTFSYGEKTSLFLKYLSPLVEGAVPDMDFDLDAMKGMKVKMLWNEKNGFQSIETIRPLGKKLSDTTVPTINLDAEEPPESEWGSLEPDPELPPELQ